ncbi:MAG: hypothetical protein FWF49_00955 [Oscillospiraceae bacterium]|nr:hypothetical protein [Oscillospiraceae bacterium]
MKHLFLSILSLLLSLAFLAGCTPAAPVSAPEDTATATTTTMGAATTTDRPLGGVQLGFGAQTLYLWVDTDGAVALLNPCDEPYSGLALAGMPVADAIGLILETGYTSGDITGATTITHAPADSYNGFDVSGLDTQVQDAINAFVGTLASSGVSVSVSQVTQASTTMTIPPQLTTATTTATSTTATTSTTAQLMTGLDLKTKAATAMSDMYNSWWDGSTYSYYASGASTISDSKTDYVRNNILKTDHGYALGSAAAAANGFGGNQQGKLSMIWEFSQMTSDMYSFWMYNSDATTQTRMGQQYDFLLNSASTKAYTNILSSSTIYLGSGIAQAARVGQCGSNPNIALDDSTWDALYFMQVWHMTGNATALADTRTLILGAYDYYQDGNTGNGLWYPQYPPTHGGDSSSRFKSLYGAGMIAAAFDYLLAVGKANWDSTDQTLYDRTLAYYNWMEATLLRASAASVNSAGATGSQFTLPLTVTNGMAGTGATYTTPGTAQYADNLYWCTWLDNCTGYGEKNGPDGGSRSVLDIGEAGSVSSLGGNMAMALCHERLYKLTNDVKYLNRAVRTAQGLTNSPKYNKSNVLLADRDAWTDGFYAGMYAKEVLTLPGIRNADKNLLMNTAYVIANSCRVQNGGNYYYNADWRGTHVWQNQKNVPGMGDPLTIMTSGISANMIIAGALVEKMG